VHLAALSKERTNYSLRRFRETALDMGHKWSRIDPSACDLYLGRQGRTILHGGRTIPDLGAALVRRGSGIEDLEITMVNQLEHTGVPVINGTYALLVSRDKYWSLRRLADQGVPVPRTVVLNDPKGVERAYKVTGDPPVILKVLRGMRGTGVMIADSKKSVRSILETFQSQGTRVLVQEYVAESQGTDTRVLVVGGKAVAAMRREAPIGEFRSNIHKGGKGYPVQPDARSRELAERAATIVGLDVAGVDLIETHDGPKVMEVNSSPGFDGLEKATGRDIARLILEHAVAVAEGRKKTMAARLAAGFAEKTRRTGRTLTRGTTPKRKTPIRR
jgi:ribosomal protein S6--L-glutamate ligase